MKNETDVVLCVFTGYTVRMQVHASCLTHLHR